MKKKTFGIAELIGGFLGTGLVVFILSAIPAWFTHVIFCIQHQEWIFLLAGAIFFPIGIIHGWGLWFGFF